MKKKFFVFVLSICLILLCVFIMSGCDDGITDCAYIQLVPANSDEVVQYTAQMYADIKAHIFLFENENMKNNGAWEDNYLLKISFSRNLGVDYNIDEKDTLCVSIEKWFSMEICIKKEYYDSSKKVYLNGEDITSKAISTLSKPPEEGSTVLGSFWYDGIFYFENFGLVKGNTSNFINTIEYK